MMPSYHISSLSDSATEIVEPVKVSVIIPTLNEEKNLQHVLPRIPKWVHEVIIVDGRSTDKTVEVARSLIPDVVVVMEKRKGKGIAIRTGFAAATGDIIVMIDADGSMAPEEIPLFVGAVMAGADYVRGSRFMQGGGTDDMELYRRLGNWGILMIARVLFGGNFSDFCYGYCAFSRNAIKKLELRSTGFEIETEINVRALQTKLRIAEVPSFESPRVHGKSNLSAVPDGLRIVRVMVKEFFGARLQSNSAKTQETKRVKKDETAA